MPDHIGANILFLRLHGGLTLRALATAARMPVSTLSAVEHGTRRGAGLTLATACRLATALGVSLDRLVRRKESGDTYV